MKTKLIKIKRKFTLPDREVDVYLNPAYITSIQPEKDGSTRIDYFSSTSFIGTNLAQCCTLESVESLVRRINELE